MVQLNWTYQAVLDLREIAEYISKDSQKYAKIQIQRIKLRTQILNHIQLQDNKLIFMPIRL